MPLRLFNSLHRQVEDFSPLEPGSGSVGFYCCGPTVYDFGHIGNFRTFVFADLLRRHLEFRGHRVNHVMNITDVEDKIIRQVAATGLGLAVSCRSRHPGLPAAASPAQGDGVHPADHRPHPAP